MRGHIMAINSVSSTAQNSNIFLQQQEQVGRARDLEDSKKNDAVTAKPLDQKVDAQKAVAQQVVVEKSDAQKVDAQVTDEKKAVVQAATRPSVNTNGQVVGTIIDTQA
jgi:hypothetical protein